MIFIPPIGAYTPRTYRKVIRSETHITGVDCIARVYVHFPQAIICDPKTLERDHLQDSTYAFQIKISLSRDEYESNKFKLDDYVYYKLNQLDECSMRINDILSREPEGREYEINVHIPKDSLDYLKLHTYETAIEEYVPV